MTTTLWCAVGVIVLINVLYVAAGMRWQSNHFRRQVFAVLDRLQLPWPFEMDVEEIAKIAARHTGHDPAVLVPYVRQWLRERAKS